MDTRRDEISPSDLVSEAGGLMTGMGVLSVMWVPFAVPALVLALPLVLPLIVLGPPLLAGWLLVRGVKRLVRRGRSGPHADRAAGRSTGTLPLRPMRSAHVSDS